MARDTHRLLHSAMERRRHETEAILDKLAGSNRVVLSGGPRTGKSTLAVRAGERYRRTVRHADALIGQKDWSEQSDAVSKWIDEDGDYIIEGVSAPRALRKWLRDNPGKKLDLTIVHFREPVQFQTDKQRAMAKGVETVWQQIRDELKERGANVIERETSAPASEIVGMAAGQSKHAPARVARPAPTVSAPGDEPDEEPSEPMTIRNVR